MNLTERKMVDVLTDLRENNHVIGIKAEFEAEGTRMEEALRLKEVCMKAGLGITLKIGGCEAIKDMYESRVIGVERIVAPMIETAYALKKFIQATKLVYPDDEKVDLKFAVNIETIAGVNAFDKMLALPEISAVDGIIMGRVDLTGSLGLTREDINSKEVLEITRGLFIKAKAKNLECAVGGGVSAHSFPFFRELGKLIDRFETRKVIFSCPEALAKDEGILKAVGFELLWLKNKRDYYGLIFKEDAQRIIMLESRYKGMIEKAGGKYE
ncbi:MAG: aldolase/citrate lyase family protein [Deltaproteobacteria bacterium]|nr:aldolase/citrate lyase family protein [Deltaproteobacteria bacterium]